MAQGFSLRHFPISPGARPIVGGEPFPPEKEGPWGGTTLTNRERLPKIEKTAADGRERGGMYVRIGADHREELLYPVPGQDRPGAAGGR